MRPEDFIRYRNDILVVKAISDIDLTIADKRASVKLYMAGYISWLNEAIAIGARFQMKVLKIITKFYS